MPVCVHALNLNVKMDALLFPVGCFFHQTVFTTRKHLIDFFLSVEWVTVGQPPFAEHASIGYCHTRYIVAYLWFKQENLDALTRTCFFLWLNTIIWNIEFCAVWGVYFSMCDLMQSLFSSTRDSSGKNRADAISTVDTSHSEHDQVLWITHWVSDWVIMFNFNLI